jgi:ribosomal protein L31E
MSTDKIKVSIETMAGLYAAANRQREEAERAMALIRSAIARHGFTEEAVVRYIATSDQRAA